MGGDASGSSTPGTSSRVSARERPATAVALPKCRHARVAKAKTVSYGAPSQMVKKGKQLTAVVKTNCGTFSIALDAKRFPITVNSFVFLAQRHFYDGVPFDEAGAGTYLHGGDPRGKPKGPGYTVRGSIPEGIAYRYGVVAMAQPGEPPPGQAGSQFFIVLAKPWIDTSSIYPPIGTVKGGMDVLQGISQFGAHSPGPHNLGVFAPVGKLSRPVVIEGIAIRKG
jgi:cyclophilin family peptidyl-prolyl cis-trans isomerase